MLSGDRLAELKSDGREICCHYLPTVIPLLDQDDKQAGEKGYYPLMIPPTPLSKFIDKIDWKDVNSQKKTKPEIVKYCNDIERNKRGYEAEVAVYRALERLKFKENTIVLHGLKYTPSEFSEETGECDFVVMGKNYFVIIEVKQNEADVKEANTQADRTERLIEGIVAKVSKKSNPQILKLSSCPYSAKAGDMKKQDLENDESFRTWWKSYVIEKLSDESQQSPSQYEDTVEILIALWANRNDRCEKERCSIGWNVLEIDEKLNKGLITFIPNSGIRNFNSNPNVVEAPDLIKQSVGIEYLTAKQEEILRSDQKLLLISGPAGSGKTVILAGKLIELVKSDPDKKVVLFKFGKEMNENCAIYETMCEKADISYTSQCLYNNDQLKAPVIANKVLSSTDRVLMLRIKIECRPLSYTNNWLEEALRLLGNCNILVDDLQCIYTTSLCYIHLLDTIYKSDNNTIWVTYDIAQNYNINTSQWRVDKPPYLQRWDGHHVALRDNLRNTCDLSVILLVIRDHLSQLHGPFFDSIIMPKQCSGTIFVV